MTTEYYEEASWRCPECGAHEVEQGQDGNMWVVSCAGCGTTISDSYIGEASEVIHEERDGVCIGCEQFGEPVEWLLAEARGHSDEKGQP